MTRASAGSPLSLECPFRLIARCASGSGDLDVRCVGEECALFSKVSDPRFLRGKNYVAGCSLKVQNDLWRITNW